jgi:hypothetical protein
MMSVTIALTAVSESFGLIYWSESAGRSQFWGLPGTCSISGGSRTMAEFCVIFRTCGDLMSHVRNLSKQNRTINFFSNPSNEVILDFSFSPIFGNLKGKS